MEKSFEKIFDSLIADLSENIESYKKGTLTDKQKVGTSDTIPFSGQLDGNGNYNYSTSKYGAGKTVNFTATILSPNGIFNTIEIKSSDGPDNKYTNVNTGESISGLLHTSLWHSSEISISIHSDTLKSVTVSGTLTYSY